MSKYHSLPTVFSGNDYKATISMNKVKKWIGTPTSKNKTTDRLHPRHTPLFFCWPNFGIISEQRTFVKTIAMLLSGGELSSTQLNERGTSPSRQILGCFPVCSKKTVSRSRGSRKSQCQNAAPQLGSMFQTSSKIICSHLSINSYPVLPAACTSLSS